MDSGRSFSSRYAASEGGKSRQRRSARMRCAWVLGDRSSETFQPLWKIIRGWKSFWYVTDGWLVYPCFINDCDHLVLKTYMTRVEGENTRLRHYLARLKRKTLCYSKCEQMLRASIKLLLHYLHFDTIPLF